MKLAPYIPIERCRLVKYNYVDKIMDHSFDLEVSFIDHIIIIFLYIKFSFSIKLSGS